MILIPSRFYGIVGGGRRAGRIGGRSRPLGPTVLREQQRLPSPRLSVRSTLVIHRVIVFSATNFFSYRFWWPRFSDLFCNDDVAEAVRQLSFFLPFSPCALCLSRSPSKASVPRNATTLHGYFLASIVVTSSIFKHSAILMN